MHIRTSRSKYTQSAYSVFPKIVPVCQYTSRIFISCTTSTSALVGERSLGKELEGSEV